MSNRVFTYRFIGSVFIVLASIALLATPALAYFMPGNAQAATRVLGQADFTGSFGDNTAGGLNFPASVAVDPTTQKVFVADVINNRVLRFASASALSDGAPAEAVLGQPNFTSAAAATTRNGMSDPYAVFVDATGSLWVAEFGNNRVLRFNNAAARANGANANGVLGQPNFTSNTSAATQSGMSGPEALFVDTAGHLWLSDTVNNRVLRFDNAGAKADGANADGVLGQPDFTSHTSRSGMFSPEGLFVDSGPRLWVADLVNNRVLRFDIPASLANGANASAVLGQPGYAVSTPHTSQNGMHFPFGVSMDSSNGRLYVSDQDNNRVLVFNSAVSLANGANASYVLGQPDFTSAAANGGGLSATTLSGPDGVFFDPWAKVLWVADSVNNRVLMYGQVTRYLLPASTAAQDGWVRESRANSNVGGTFSTAGTLRLGDDATNRQFRSILSFDTSGLPAGAVIRGATLEIEKAGLVGIYDPMNNFTPLLVDIQNGSFGASALEATDFQAAATTSLSAQFAPIRGQPGWYQLALALKLKGGSPEINRSGVTQLRLRFSLKTNGNLAADYDTFFGGDAAAADRPVLSIQYTLP